VGTLDSSAVHPRELFKSAIKKSAAAVILVHNHPSGDPTPSQADIELTRRLVQAGGILGIGILDHIVVGDNKYTSFKACGLL
jgi:DNA repair protein RadC